jgi:hypothetical protein
LLHSHQCDIAYCLRCSYHQYIFMLVVIIVVAPPANS